MARKGTARSVPLAGQHVALAVAAQLARTQLVPDPPGNCPGAPLRDLLDAVGQALARTATLHVTDAQTGATREIDPAELEGAVAKQGATLLVLKDGRALSGLSVRRADLRQAIALLKALGVPQLAASPPPAAATAPDGNGEALGARLAELEQLLTPPLLPEQVDRAKAGAVWIARHAAQGRVANLAMQLMSALHETDGSDEIPGGFRLALARLRAAIKQPGV